MKGHHQKDGKATEPVEHWKMEPGAVAAALVSRIEAVAKTLGGMLEPSAE